MESNLLTPKMGSVTPAVLTRADMRALNKTRDSISNGHEQTACSEPCSLVVKPLRRVVGQ